MLIVKFLITPNRNSHLASKLSYSARNLQ